MQEGFRRQSLSRRSMMAGGAGLAGAAVLASRTARAQQPTANLGTPASVVSNPLRDFARGHPSIYPDPDVIVVDPSFLPLRRTQGAIYRVWTGALWAEGPTWSNQGHYLVFSDVSGNTLYRYIWDDGRVTVFRRPSSNANGNAFDFQGRLLSCEDFTRRLVRWEHDGTMTVIADSYEGKPLNSPNGVAPHPDGSIWFTDPGYGDQIAEGHPDEAGGPTNPQGILNPRIGAPDAGVIGGRKRELPTNTYCWDPSGKLEVVASQEELPDPNGLCFSPDHKTFYLISTGKGRAIPVRAAMAKSMPSTCKAQNSPTSACLPT
jgi:gluconolactonase